MFEHLCLNSFKISFQDTVTTQSQRSHNMVNTHCKIVRAAPFHKFSDVRFMSMFDV